MYARHVSLAPYVAQTTCLCAHVNGTEYVIEKKKYVCEDICKGILGRKRAVVCGCKDDAVEHFSSTKEAQ